VGATIAGLFLSCSGASSTAPGAGSIAAIIVAPDSVSLTAGSSDTFEAHAQTASHAMVSGATFFWSTSDSLVATVTQEGVVTGREPGAAQISASAEGKSGFARIIVVRPVVRSVRITPSRDTIYATKPGDTATLVGVALDSAGSVLGGHPLVWPIGGTIAVVNSDKVSATGAGAGRATVTATSADTAFASGTATVDVIGHIARIVVNPPFALLSTSEFTLPSTVQLSATLTDTFGTNVSGDRVLTWSSDDRTVATVDRHGLVTAVSTSEASTTITATTPDGRSASVTVTVFP